MDAISMHANHAEKKTEYIMLAQYMFYYFFHIQDSIKIWTLSLKWININKEKYIFIFPFYGSMQGQIEYRSKIKNWRILWVTSPGDSTALSQCSYI